MLAELDHCAFGYSPGRPVVRVEGRVAIERGRCLGVYGPNGAGKTTLLRGSLGLLRPMAGTLRQPRPARSGYVPQHRNLEMHWPMTALDVVLLATSARRRFGWAPRGAAARHVREAMADMRVQRFAGEPFASLSGGQQQRVLLAGALADQPELLVLDEPTDDLDAPSRRLLLSRLAQLMEDGLAAVLVSHDAASLRRLCGQVLVLAPSNHPGHPSRASLVPASALSSETGEGEAEP